KRDRKRLLSRLVLAGERNTPPPGQPRLSQSLDECRPDRKRSPGHRSPSLQPQQPRSFPNTTAGQIRRHPPTHLVCSGLARIPPTEFLRPIRVDWLGSLTFQPEPDLLRPPPPEQLWDGSRAPVRRPAIINRFPSWHQFSKGTEQLFFRSARDARPESFQTRLG